MKNLIAAAIMAAMAIGYSQTGADQSLNGAGATFPAPLYTAWAYEYNKTTGIKLNYQSIGSGGGQRQISERTVDFGASDDPLETAALAKSNLLQFPTVIGGVTPVVNVPGIKAGELKLDGQVLCKIFLGRITSWDDPGIKALNPELNLSHSDITVVHRSDGSGTTAIFTHYLGESCPEWQNRVGEGKSVSWPAGIGGKGNEGVANYVKQAVNSIGYVEFAYAMQNKLVPVKLRNRAGNFVKPGFGSFQNAAETGNFEPGKDFFVWLTNSPGKTAWPIAGATFILLAADKKDSGLKTLKFFEWAFTNGDATAKNLIYVPLPEAVKKKVRAYWKEKGVY